mmetsp:Transcript_117427/g.377185  ORF Transcript_117427/g.377185 Transcript_117427/m.377185 type:complete len:317 (-) Transcript_117427:2881-3831(-)
MLRVATHHGCEAVLLGQQFEEVTLHLLAVQLEGIVSAGDEFRIVAEERPIATVHGQLAVLNALGQRVALTDARRVGHDEARSRVGIGLQHRSDGLLRVHVHADGSHVHSLVGHGQAAQVLLRRLLAALRELGHGACRRGLRGLAAGVAVHLRVQDKDVDVLLAGDDVVQAAVADVIGPAIASDDPEADAAELVPQVEQLLELRVASALLLQQGLQLLHHLVVDAATTGQQQVVLILLAHEQELCQQLAQLLAHADRPIAQSILHLQGQEVPALLESPAHAEAKLGVVLEKGVGPCRPLALGVDGVWEGRVRGAPNG